MQVEIYIPLVDEPASSPTQAIVLGENRYLILEPSDYNPEAEEWEFLPGSIVACEECEYNGKRYLRANKQVD